MAKEKRIHADIPILKKLNDSVHKFEKFRKDYTMYQKFRERIKHENSNLSHLDSKFTTKFIKRLIEES